MDQPRPWYQRNYFLLPLCTVLLIASYLVYQELRPTISQYQDSIRSTNQSAQPNIAESPKASNPEKAKEDNTQTYSRPKTFLNNLPLTQSATCYFESVTSTTFENPDDPFADIEKRLITFSNEKQSKPNIVAFVDLDTPNPKLTANQGQGELLKIVDTPEIVTLIEKAPVTTGDNVIVYTIYKTDGVATWTKQYKLLTTPYALLSMGYCE